MSNKPVFSKDFILVALGQIVSIFGNQILRYALPLYLLNETGSSALFGTILAISFIPMILLFPIGGVIADRINKRNIMVTLDFSTAILVALFYLFSGTVDTVLLIAVTMLLLFGIQGAYQPAVKASVPALVDPEHMMAVNSIVDMINSSASVAGPVIGGLLFSMLGLNPILYVSFGCFFLSAVMEIFIHIPFERRKPTKNIAAAGLDDLNESFRFMFRERPVLCRISFIFGASNLLLTALLQIGLPVLITQYLGFPPDTASRLYGYTQGTIAAGAVFGGLLAGVLSRKLTAESSPFLLIGCSLCILIEGIALQTLNQPYAVCLVLAVGSGLMLAIHTLFQIQIVTYLQILTPMNMIGKVISCFMCVVMCTGPVGQFIYGYIFDHIGSRMYLPFYFAALTMTAITVVTRRTFHGIIYQSCHS